jgi:hypothetical protein
MELPRGVIPELVPEDVPPPETVPPDALGLATRIVDPVLRRAYLWSNALTLAGLAALPPGCTHFSSGFVYVQPGTLEASGWARRARESFLFGGYALVDSEETHEGSLPQRIISTGVGRREFPLVITFGQLEPDGCPPHPNVGNGAILGSSACWVRRKSNAQHAQWNDGVLTCRHVVKSLAQGQLVGLDASANHPSLASGRLGKMDGCTIDAAIIEIAVADWPPALTPLTIHPAISPGMTVQVQFSGRTRSAPRSGSVLRTFQHPPYFSNLFGQRVITDFTGQPGDSGSLLTDTAAGKGIGLYMGKIPDGSGGWDGIYQDLHQAAMYFEFDPFI